MSTVGTPKSPEQIEHDWDTNPRWKGIERTYTPADVVALQGSVIEDYLFSNPELLHRPTRVTIEHDAAVALGDKLEIISHVHPAGSTEQFGEELADRTVTTLTYAVGDETKAVAAIFAL